MTTLTFDTLASANRMKEKGIPAVHAEAFAMELKAASDTDVSHLATKEELNTFKSEMKSDFKALDTKIETSLRELELRMTTKLGTMLFLAVGIMAGLIKYLSH